MTSSTGLAGHESGPLVVGISGSLRAGSSTETLIREILEQAKLRGASTRLFTGAELALPPYDPESGVSTPEAAGLVGAVRVADALVIGSPGYHGGLSGLLKNALDYLEECRNDERPYLDGIPVAPVVTAYGWQAAVNTMRALRDVIHALRGWPTPLGIALNVAGGLYIRDGALVDPQVQQNVRLITAQLLQFHTPAEQAPDDGGPQVLVIEQIRRAIYLGRFLPGDKLPSFDELAQQLSVPVEFVREAAAALEEEGLLRSEGATFDELVVHDTRIGDSDLQRMANQQLRMLEDIFDFRVANEEAAARLAARRRTPEDIEQLRKAVARMDELFDVAAGSDELGSAEVVARFRSVDTEFHVGVARSARNELLAKAIEDTRAAMFLPTGAVFRQLEPNANDYHKEILRALEAGDEDAAARAVRAHIDGTRARLEDSARVLFR